MSSPANQSDEQLLRALSTGDDLALTELISRHARGVHDFVLRSTMDVTQALEITEAAFERLRTTINLPPQIDTRTWLYSLALVEILAVATERRMSRIDVEDTRFIQSSSEFDREILLWAWQAARGLRTRDYCVLDLTLRRGLTPEELADSASLTRNNLYASIGRARGAFEETFGATVLYMRGRSYCAELEELVSSTAGGGVRPALRHQIADHADACETCRKTLATLPLASEVFVSLIDVDLPDGLRGQLSGEETVATPAAVEEAAEAPAEAAQAAADEGAIFGAAEAEASLLFDMPSEARPLDGAGSPAFPPIDRGARGRRLAGREQQDDLASRRPEPFSARDYHFEEPLSQRVASWFETMRRQPVIWSWVLGGIATVLAIYLALAVGDSLQGGSGSSGAVPLESASGGVQTGRVIDCPAPITLNQGTSSVVSFDSKALDGYEIGGLAVEPKSQGATAVGLVAAMTDPYTISFNAAGARSSTARTDEYALRISWRKDEQVATSTCSVTVRVPASIDAAR